MIRIAMTFVLAIAAAAPALAQEPAETERIVVHGRRPGPVTSYDVARGFILEIAAPATPRSGYARWDDRICVGVRNLRADRAQYVVDRVSQIALDLGLRPGGPDCRPNIVVMFTEDGRELAGRLVREQRSLFRPYGGVGGTTQGLRALDAFATSDAPVRWWQVTMPVDRDGNAAVRTGQGTDGVPVINSPGFLLVSPTSDQIRATYVIVDATKLGDATWPQLADYVAMVALAQIDPSGGPVGQPSILDLFDAADPADGLTAWDEAYLRALYGLDQTGRPSVQRNALVNAIAHDERLDAEGD